MCLAVPGKIVSIVGDDITLDYGSEKRKGKLLNKKLKIGDYAIMQGQMVFQKIEKKEAEQALKLYQEATEADS